MEEGQPKKSVLPKLLLVLCILCLLVAAILVYAVKYEGLKLSSKTAEKVEPPVAAAPVIPVPPPPPPEAPSIAMARTLISGTPEERKTAAAALIALPDPQPEAVALLTQAVTTSTAAPRVEIIATLGQLAPKNPEIVPTLKTLAADKKEPLSIRKAASSALAKLQPAKEKSGGKHAKKGKKKKT